MVTKFITSLAYWTEIGKGLLYKNTNPQTNSDWIREPNGDVFSSNRETTSKKSKGQNGHPAQNSHYRLSFHEAELKWVTEERISYGESFPTKGLLLACEILERLDKNI